MSFNCGFFNAVGGDRKYNAEQMNNPYAKIVSDGVFASPSGTASTDMQVQATGGLSVLVRSGRGMFAGKWAHLDADMPLTIPTPHVSLARIDSVIVRIDERTDVRAGSILYREGTAAAAPQPPTLTNTSEVHEYRLANITVEPNATIVTQSKISDTRPTDECGYIHNLLWNSDITATYSQWEAQFREWFDTLRETLATATIITSFTNQYVTTENEETDIPIGIERYNPVLDILQVYVNGLFLAEGADYEVLSASTIRLTLGLDVDTPVSFVVYKSVDGSEAESVVRQVEELYLLAPVKSNGAVKVSIPNTGDVLDAFKKAGVGFRTMYSAYGAANSPKLGAFRYIGHMTDTNYGWILAFQANGSVFANYLDGGEWQGWRTLYENSPTALYHSAGGVFPNAGVSVVPSKSLSRCARGWQLVFNQFEDDQSLNEGVQTYLIPKRSNNGDAWNGEKVFIPLAYMDGSLTQTYKVFQVYDTELVSDAANSTGDSRHIVLRGVYEY